LDQGLVNRQLLHDQSTLAKHGADQSLRIKQTTMEEVNP